MNACLKQLQVFGDQWVTYVCGLAPFGGRKDRIKAVACFLHVSARNPCVPPVHLQVAGSELTRNHVQSGPPLAKPGCKSTP